MKADRVRLKADATNATLTSVVLSILFVAVYGGCNWITAHRPDVGTWYFEWEKQIPFVPAMVIPYLSIDLFFIAAPFVCRDRAERALFARRIALAIVIAAACFLVLPLRLAFARPEISGAAGAMLNAFRSLDRPFNMFPSLHVTLAIILVDVYNRAPSLACHAEEANPRRRARLAINAWFALIVASTVLTYQHHIVDVAGGFALAAIVFYSQAGAVARRRHHPSLRIAAYYLLAAAVLTLAAILMWPRAAVLLWPAASLSIVSVGYVRGGPGVFRKMNGRIALSARVLLWPYFLGQRISLWYYRRRCRLSEEVVPGVWIGAVPSEREAAALIGQGVTAVLDLTAEFSRPRAFGTIAYRNMPILDLTAPSLAQMNAAASFIATHEASGIVYVHCKIGYSRSAAAVGAYLLKAGRARTAGEAVEMLQRARPTIVIRPEAHKSLLLFEAALAGARPATTLAHRGLAATIVARTLAGAARLLCTSPRWAGCSASGRERIYFANHTSHLDFLVLWAALPADVRARTRPVAARDYWDRTAMRRFVARRVFHAVLVDRPASAKSTSTAGHAEAIAAARRSVARLARALARGDSLVIFPEGTRGSGAGVAPFKCGLYHLCRLHPDVELVPVWLDNLHRIMPKGSAVPVPLAGGVTFGRPLRLMPDEPKDAFLARTHAALIETSQPCIWSSTAISPAW